MSTDDTEGGGETSTPNVDACECASNIPNWGCQCYISVDWYHQGYFCNSEIGAGAACDDFCTNMAGGPFTGDIYGPIACSEQSSTYSCTGWDPAGEVDYNSGTNTYLLDFVFVSALMADAEPLWGCDDATVHLGEDGFEIASANSGELLYELGLRNGDVIISLNNLKLDTYADVGQAFSHLWVNEAETEYVLEIERNSSPMELNYYVYVTSP